jgi:hypothetical protein
MSLLSVGCAPPTDAGRLYPRYDSESRILVMESRLKRPWKFGINIDGMLICDLDEDRMLANVDLHYDRERWVRREDIAWPASAIEADIVFESEVTETQSLAIPVDVVSDETATVVRIRFGERQPDTAVALSEACVAEIETDELVGLVARISG